MVKIYEVQFRMSLVWSGYTKSSLRMSSAWSGRSKSSLEWRQCSCCGDTKRAPSSLGRVKGHGRKVDLLIIDVEGGHRVGAAVECPRGEGSVINDAVRGRRRERGKEENMKQSVSNGRIIRKLVVNDRGRREMRNQEVERK